MMSRPPAYGILERIPTRGFMRIRDLIDEAGETAHIRITGEVSVQRRGFISFEIDVETRLFHYRDSNQWSNNFVRALTAADVQAVRQAMSSWPYEAVSRDADGVLHWQVTVSIGAESETFEGNRNKDAVWRHVSRLIEAIGGK